MKLLTKIRNIFLVIFRFFSNNKDPLLANNTCEMNVVQLGILDGERKLDAKVELVFLENGSTANTGLFFYSRGGRANPDYKEAIKIILESFKALEIMYIEVYYANANKYIIKDKICSNLNLSHPIEYILGKIHKSLEALPVDTQGKKPQPTSPIFITLPNFIDKESIMKLFPPPENINRKRKTVRREDSDTSSSNILKSQIIIWVIAILIFLVFFYTNI